MNEAVAGGVSLDTLKEALARKRAASSLRKVAAEVGVNATTVMQLLRGSVEPRPTTLRKLRAWYAGQPTEAPEEVALYTLLSRIPDGPERARSAELVRTVLRLGCESAGVRVPAWLRRRTAAETRGAPPRARQ